MRLEVPARGRDQLSSSDLATPPLPVPCLGQISRPNYSTMALEAGFLGSLPGAENYRSLASGMREDIRECHLARIS